MVVIYEDVASWYNGIAEFRDRNIDFEADHSSLSIRLKETY